jgi:hypothetical protein
VLLYPDVVSYGDYEVSFQWKLDEELTPFVAVPASSFSIVNVMTQEPVPLPNVTRNVGSINLSRAKSFVLVFDGYNNAFIDYLADLSLDTNASENDNIEYNNQPLTMQIKRKDKTYTHSVIVKEHQIIVNADTGNETHTLSVVTRGLDDDIFYDSESTEQTGGANNGIT